MLLLALIWQPNICFSSLQPHKNKHRVLSMLQSTDDFMSLLVFTLIKAISEVTRL